MKTKTFYDIHMHAFDLSHPSLTAFLLSFDLIDRCMDKETMKIKWRKLCFEGVKLIIKNKIEKWKSGGGNKKGDKQIFEQIVDTVSFFEIPHEYQFLVMEHYLKNCDEKSIEDSNNKIRVGDNCYDKIIICPLVIDFGYKNIPKQVHYSITPNHPVDNQIGDMFYAIRTYCRFKLELNKEKNKFKLSDEILEWYDRRDERIFEIYPFLGLDTQHYNDVEEIKNLLDKYFRDFKKEDTAEHRRECLFHKMGMLDSNLYRDRHTFTGEDADRLKKAHLASDYQHAFAGIKVYPQLGFDPYPEDSLQLEKVKFLYEYCVAKRIPITTHCSDGGYKTGDNDKFTSPLTKWAKVLNDYPELTLNFAHFGSQKNEKTEWRNAIIKLTQKYDNVYTDISCNDMKKDYDKLKKDLENNVHLQDKVLFGSDFSINMLVTDTDSYNENLEAFAKAELPYKENLCEQNPGRFLFGK